MTQLWLDGRRMDSIPLLRRFYEDCTEEVRRNVLRELVRKYRSGLLSRWLTHQHEARPQSKLAAALGGGKKSELEKLLQTEKTAEEVLSALAELCVQAEGARQDCLALLQEIMEDDTAEDSEQLAKKRMLIENQAWYSGLKPLFAHVDWNHVAVDTASFHAILLRMEEEAPAGQTTVYLCGTGSVYSIQHPLRMKKLRLVGCGDPVVRFSSLNRLKKLNMEQNELVFERFVLKTQGMELVQTDGRLIEIKEE